jgi:hypothetical protein
MRNTKVKLDDSISTLRNKEILWKESSVQIPVTFDSFMDHGTPQDAANMLTATQLRTPEDWIPLLHYCENLQTRRSFFASWYSGLARFSFGQISGLSSSYSQRFPRIL